MYGRKFRFNPNPSDDLQAWSNYAVEERSPSSDRWHHEGQLALNTFTAASIGTGL
jgi:hypothetical protein